MTRLEKVKTTEERIKELKPNADNWEEKKWMIYSIPKAWYC